MNYHIGRLVLSSLCVGAFGAAGFRWCSFCRLKPAKRTPPKTSCTKSSNTQWTEKKTTDVVIHQHSRKLLKMDVLMSETCWAYNKWNKIASDIKLVFHSSTIAMMHGPINIRYRIKIATYLHRIYWELHLERSKVRKLQNPAEISPGICIRHCSDRDNPRPLLPASEALQFRTVIHRGRRRN